MKFDKEFYEAISKLYPNGLDWGLVGILTKNSKVYTLSYDSKILSGIFEILSEPIIMQIAIDNNMEFEKAKQNQYPEFTIYHKSKPNEKIAVDIKSTYRQWGKNNELKPFGFTLGSYRSYLQDAEGKKGILYPYKEYKEHWVIGFLYSRNPECKHTEIKQVIEAAQLKTPFMDIEFFVQEKHKIAGKTPGSGNTTNIGSIKSSNIDDFKNGNIGFPHSEAFEQYWKTK